MHQRLNARLVFITLLETLGVALAVFILAWALVGLSGCSAVPPRSPSPRSEWRGLHLLGYRSDADLKELSGQLPSLARMGINVLILEVNYGFEFRSHPELRMGDHPITPNEARRFAETCRGMGIRPIPQFNCLGHQSWAKETFPLLTKYPELDLTPGAFPNNEGLYCREWNPLDLRVNKIVLALIDELIEAFQADAVHVGMDEVFLIGSEKSPATRGKDPAVVFAKAVNDLHAHLKGKRGVEMLMWGDRLIDARQCPYGAWESSENGTAPAIDRIPKDIIICDWHYERRTDYPSVPMFVKKGFCVLPSGWNKVDATEALIRYSRTVDDPRMLGHLFTTWSGKKDWIQWPPLVEGLKRLKNPSGNN